MITTFSDKTKGICKLFLLTSLLTNLVWIEEGLRGKHYYRRGGGHPGADSMVLVHITS